MRTLALHDVAGLSGETPTTEPAVNLARDAYLLQSEVKLPACRLWVNDYCVVLGRHLVESEEVNLDYARKAGIPVLRRISGGGAVYHDAGVLNYSIVCDTNAAGWALGESLRLLSSPLLRVLEGLGLAWHWEGENNVYIDGRKVAGSAQARRGGRVLHHGSVLVAADLERLGKVLRPGGRSRHAPVANLRDFVPEITVGRLSEMLRAQIAEAVGNP